MVASIIAIVPGYISCSVAGFYDNEGIAIFCVRHLLPLDQECQDWLHLLVNPLCVGLLYMVRVITLPVKIV